MTPPNFTTPRQRQIVILGSTGSIGESSLDVIALHPEQFKVRALAAHSQWQKLLQQCQKFHPERVALIDPTAAALLRNAIAEAGLAIEVTSGFDAVSALAADNASDTVVAAIVGAAGLAPTLAAVRAGKRVLLANKETLVLAGDFFMREVERCGAELLPIDSEHNAIFQCLPMPGAPLQSQGVEKIILTASGGPFRCTPITALKHVTPLQACKHPNWSMGRKISVDSATMMNKGLEVIEAHWLFNAPATRIEVLIHPQSVIHSMVRFLDGSVLAQLGQPDMRTPIAHALAYPERVSSAVAPLDFAKLGRLDFEAPDFIRFPCLGLAFSALSAGGTSAALLNAANEVAVEAFLASQLSFIGISEICAEVLERIASRSVQTLADALAADAEARALATTLIEKAQHG